MQSAYESDCHVSGNVSRLTTLSKHLKLSAVSYCTAKKEAYFFLRLCVRNKVTVVLMHFWCKDTIRATPLRNPPFPRPNISYKRNGSVLHRHAACTFAFVCELEFKKKQKKATFINLVHNCFGLCSFLCLLKWRSQHNNNNTISTIVYKNTILNLLLVIRPGLID